MHRPSASSQIFGTQRSCMIRAQGQRAGSTDRCLALACRGLDDSGRHRDGTGGGRLLARVAAGAPRAASAEPTFVCSRRCVMVDSARRCASWRQTQCRWIGTKGAHAFGAHGARLEGHVHCCRVVLPCVACHALCRPCHGACPQVDLAHGPVGDACAHRWRTRRARPIEQQWRACRAASARARSAGLWPHWPWRRRRTGMQSCARWGHRCALVLRRRAQQTWCVRASARNRCRSTKRALWSVPSASSR